MPKIVDHEKRKARIAKATWQVILKYGMKGASVRNIAREAKLSPGALRHYFPNQNELYAYAMNLVSERVKKRLGKVMKQDLPPVEKVIAILEEFLPLDEESSREMKVWFHFMYHYYDQGEDLNDGIREAVKLVFDYLDAEDLLKEDMVIELEIERLYAIIDGLAIHKIIRKQQLSNDVVRKVLRTQVESLIKK